MKIQVSCYICSKKFTADTNSKDDLHICKSCLEDSNKQHVSMQEEIAARIASGENSTLYREII